MVSGRVDGSTLIAQLACLRNRGIPWTRLTELRNLARRFPFHNDELWMKERDGATTAGFCS